MPDLSELVGTHGAVKRYRIELVVEHNDGFTHKIASNPVRSRNGFSADDMHRELLKSAGQLAVLDIATDAREKKARSRR